jgi:superfamily II DNA or RNA helicase
MSTLIPIGSLTESQLKQIETMLSIVPIDKEEEERKKWNKMASSKIPSKPKEIIPMFQIDYMDGAPYIRVPFRFGSAFLNKLANRDPEQAKNYIRVDFDFKAKLREAQIPVAEEAFKQLVATGCINLRLNTGFGKTLLSLYLAGLAKGIIAVNIPVQAVTDSWISTFEKCYPTMKEKIWIVGENEMPKDPVFILFMHTRYEKIPKELRNKISCYIIDESHLFCTPCRVPTLLSIQPRYVIALSATPDRNDGLESMIHTIAGNQEVERVSENPFKLIKLRTGIKIEEERGMFGLNYSKFVNDQANCFERNIMAINIINGNKHKKYMILTKTKEHVTNLETMFKHYGLPCTTYFGSKKSYKDDMILIGSLSKVATGFDMATAAEEFDGVNADVLILMTTIKNENLLKQTIGRVVGRAPSPAIIYFLDENSSSKRHINLNKAMIEKVKGEVIEIKYNGSVAGGGIVLK